MSSLPPNRNLPAPKSQQNGDLLKRTGQEKAIEDSMRVWHNMKEERDDALEQNNNLRTKIVELEAEKAILADRNHDLEAKNEDLLIRLTTMRTKIENIGQLGDSISLVAYEILTTPQKPSQSAPSEDPLKELERGLAPFIDPPRATEPLLGAESTEREWPSSNSPSPKPMLSTPTPGIKPDATLSPSRWRR